MLACWKRILAVLYHQKHSIFSTALSYSMNSSPILVLIWVAAQYCSLFWCRMKQTVTNSLQKRSSYFRNGVSMTISLTAFTKLLEPQYPLESQFTYSTDQFTENGIQYHSNTNDHEQEWRGVLCNAAKNVQCLQRFMYFTGPHIYFLQTETHYVYFKSLIFQNIIFK
jgi:hypothetical protein